MFLQIIDWPESLAWVLQHLKPYQHQLPPKPTVMEDGTIRPRPRSTPQLQYEATVDLDDHEFKTLQSIARSYIRARLPDSESAEVVLFALSKDYQQTPYPLVTSSTNGGPTTHTVRLDLKKIPTSLLQAAGLLDQPSN